MSISNSKYNGKSTLLKLKRLMSSTKIVKSNKKDTKDRIGYLHVVDQNIKDCSGNIVMNNKFVNVIMSNNDKNYENAVINSYRISDIFNIERSDKTIKIVSKNKNCSIESIVTLLETK